MGSCMKVCQSGAENTSFSSQSEKTLLFDIELTTRKMSSVTPGGTLVHVKARRHYYGGNAVHNCIV